MGYESAVKSTSRRVISRPQPTVHEAVESNRRQKLTPFKTPVHIQDRDLVRNRGRQTHFKTLGKSGTKVSRNLTPFKTPDVTHRTGRVHFKTFDDWIEARRANCDTLLKDVSSFVSEKMEEDQQRSYPSHRQPNSQMDKEEW